jgi:hypothetical protein
MKRTLAVGAVVLLMFAGQAGANPIPWGGDLAPWGDSQATTSYIYDNAAGILSVYIVQLTFSEGMTASQFAAPKPECFQASFLSDTAVFPVTIGNSQTGVAVGYGACLIGPIHVLTLNFFAQGLTADCCFYATVPHPGVPSGRIEAVNCDSEIVYLNGGLGVINPDPRQCTNAVVPTTWGKIKSVFANE